MNSLTPFAWQNRIILVQTTAANTPTIEQTLRNADFDIVDRDIIWFIVADGSVSSNYGGAISDTFAQFLVNNYFSTIGQEVVLVGKDTGVKSRAAVLDLWDIFGQIDVMPMRRQEMQQP